MQAITTYCICSVNLDIIHPGVKRECLVLSVLHVSGILSVCDKTLCSHQIAQLPRVVTFTHPVIAKANRLELQVS